MVSNNFLKNFEISLLEASKVFNKHPSKINLDQFWSVAKGKNKSVSLSTIRMFGYAPIRNCVAPQKDTNKAEVKAMKDLIARLAKG